MRLAILGTGLIGASVGLAAKKAGADHVAGFDPDGAALAAGIPSAAPRPVAPSMRARSSFRERPGS